ncbi:MAG: glutathione S-transferase [Myxococcota bacterium]
MFRVYGSRISYFTGKLEAYLRYRGHAYTLLPTHPHASEIARGTGSTQMPAMQLEDGRWTSDTTPLLAWLDGRDAGDAGDGAPSIYPAEPALRFVALLVEDHADEWLWRPAMHYRWSYRLDRDHASGLLTDEQTSHVRLPRALKRRRIVRRQLGGYVMDDGVGAQTRAHVEAAYLAALDQLEAILAQRRFLLGDAPSIADFGMMGPMLRHFGQDPTPADVMRSRAPGVYAWVARVWNTRATRRATTWIPAIDAPLAALLREICETHLVQLRENAIAVAAGQSRFDQEIQGVRYARLPTGRYRVHCLEVLRRAWAALGADARERLQPFLAGPGASVLWDETTPLGSGYDPAGEAPFGRARNVFDKDVRPKRR